MALLACTPERQLSARAAAGLLVLVLAGVLGIGPGPARLAAQQGDDEAGSQDVALLSDGPELGRGLPFLPANVIPHYRGRYEYQKSEIDVFYTEKEIVRFSSWQPVDCEGYRLYRLDGAGQSEGQAAGQPADVGPIVERPVFFYETDQYALFIRAEQRYLCTFFPRFMSEFVYFRSVQNFAANRPPFPAVVD
ncbi:MAG: hypothetical protein ACOCZA_10385 [Spirochaetota bacterium]